MKILVTGATGYIGKRLIPLLSNSNHHVVCAVRDKLRADKSYAEDDTIDVIETDFLEPESLHTIPKDIDVAFYLIHSMSNSSNDFETLHEPSLYIITRLEIICCVNIVELNDCGQSVGKAVKIIKIRFCRTLMDGCFGICGVIFVLAILIVSVRVL